MAKKRKNNYNFREILKKFDIIKFRYRHGFFIQLNF